MREAHPPEPPVAGGVLARTPEAQDYESAGRLKTW
jgi:hypothetical protein